MPTEWVVDVPVERLVLDAQNRGEIVFTVTNVGSTAGRVVLEVVPAEGVDRSWFTVEEPRRSIAAGASDAYRVTLAPPAGTQPGSYLVQARVYPDEVGIAPEEASRLSKRVQFEVRETPPPKKRPWWPYALAAALALIVVITLVWVLVGRGGGGPNPGESPSPSGSAPASAPPSSTPPTTGPPPTTAGPLFMPDVLGDFTASAVATLRAMGLTVRVQSRVDPVCNFLGQVIEQIPDPGTRVFPGDIVTIVVGERPPPPRECP